MHYDILQTQLTGANIAFTPEARIDAMLTILITEKKYNNGAASSDIFIPFHGHP
jgi:hypothetical protein